MRRVKEIKKTPITVKIKRICWVILIGGFVGFWMTPAGHKTVQAVKNVCSEIANRAHLIVDQVEAEGNHYTTKESIGKALNVSQGMDIFDVDLKEARKNLSDLPWVKSAVIERRLPATLFVKIKEKQLLAVWQNDKQYFPLDTDGHVIRDQKTKLPPVLLVVGKEAPKHVVALVESLKKYPDIQSKVKSAVWVGNRRWDLYLDDVSDGLIVKLPDEKTDEALKQLSEKQNQDKIFKKDLKSIDLRNPNQVVVRLREGKK